MAPVSVDELQDLTAVRSELESLGLRQAIERGDVAWEARLLGAPMAVGE